MTQKSAGQTISLPWRSLAQAWPAAAVALLGVVLLFGAGFAEIPALHNAAHDARHLFTFPCH